MTEDDSLRPSATSLFRHQLPYKVSSRSVVDLLSLVSLLHEVELVQENPLDGTDVNGHHSVLAVFLAKIVESLLRVLVPNQVEAVADERNPDRRSRRIIIRQSSFVIPEKDSGRNEQDHFDQHFGSFGRGLTSIKLNEGLTIKLMINK